MMRLSTVFRPSVLGAVASILALAAPVSAQMAAGALPAHGAPGASPHGHHEGEPPQDGILEDATLPPQTLVISVRGAQEEPLAGAEITFTTELQSIAQGNKKSSRKLITDERGEVRLDGLDGSLRTSYEISLTRGKAEYRLDPFRVSDKTGLRAIVHVFESTSDINDAFVGMRGFIYVTLRESQFHFDVLYRVMNMSRVAWVPEGLTIPIPSAAEAATADEKLPTFRPRDDNRIALEGTFPPGYRDVRFQFQVPVHNLEREQFTLGVLPHVGELRVIAEATSQMTLHVSGFEAPQRTKGPEDAPVLVTRRVMRPGEGELQTVTIELGGLPIVGPERWYAAGLALALAASGLALRRRTTLNQQEKERLREEAKQALLKELELLENALQREIIGPQTYESTKRQLIDALARLALEAAPHPAAPAAPAAAHS